jgi:predicted transcriptional regulator with HTH domain
MKGMMNTYRSSTIGLGLVDCGEKTGYQIQNMSSLNTTITLLNDTPDSDLAPDPDLVVLAKKVNQFFEP